MTAFSYQLYSSRNFPPLADTLAMLAKAGYAQVEGYGALYADESSLAVMEKGLKDNGLTMPTGHFSLEMCRDNPARVLEIARVLGVKAVIVPYIMPDDRPKNAAGWTAFGKELARVGKPFRDAGLAFGYHNHDFEFIPTETGELPLDLILAAGDGIKLELDVAWSVKGKADAAATLRKYASRLIAVHVKDIAPEGQNKDEDGWAYVGQGTMGWNNLFPLLREIGVEYLVLEHDNPKNHADFASKSINAAKGF